MRPTNSPYKSSDISGKRFGMLVAISRNYVMLGHHWNFLCDCGEVCVKNKYVILAHQQQSCGCLSCTTKPHFKPGKKYGRLTLLERVGNDKDRAAQWKLRCDCGKVSIMPAHEVVNGRSKSCGCANRFKPKPTIVRKEGLFKKCSTCDNEVPAETFRKKMRCSSCIRKFNKRPDQIARKKESMKKIRKEMTDGYIRKLLRSQRFKDDIPVGAICLKKEIIAIQRLNRLHRAQSATAQPRKEKQHG